MRKPLPNPYKSQTINVDFIWQEQLWANRDAGWLTPQLVDRLQTGMTDPRPIPEVLMIAMRRDGHRMLRKAKMGEIDGNDVYLLFRKPGREPYAMHFVVDEKGKETIDTYYSDYAKFVKMVDDGAAGFDLAAPPEDEDEPDPRWSVLGGSYDQRRAERGRGAVKGGTCRRG